MGREHDGNEEEANEAGDGLRIEPAPTSELDGRYPYVRVHRPQPLADHRTQISRSGGRYRENVGTKFSRLVDGPRSRLLRPWSRVPGARCGHVALSLNCKDLVPNGALSAIH